MDKIDVAISRLTGDTRLVIIGEKGEFVSQRHGIAPLIEALDSGKYASSVAADLIVGKAAALIYAKMGIVRLHARTLGKSAISVLDRFGIKYTYGELTDFIRARTGDGMCPMERTVANIDDPDEAVKALRATLARLAANKIDK